MLAFDARDMIRAFTMVGVSEIGPCLKRQSSRSEITDRLLSPAIPPGAHSLRAAWDTVSLNQ